MPLRLLFFFLGAFGANVLSAQIGCPGCQTSLPPLPEDTLYLQELPDGEQGLFYDHDISFRVPKTTTPVNAVDSTTPPNLPISKIEIVSVEGLPPGLNWQPNQWVFQTDQQTDGCIRICGTPAASDTFLLNVKIKATVFVITQEASFPLRLYIAPLTVSNDGFSMSDFIGCGSTTVTFTNNNPSADDAEYSYTWDFGDGASFEGENPPPHTYDTPGVYPVHYYAAIDTGGYVLTSATVLAVTCVDQLGLGEPDLYLLVKDPDGETIFDSSPDVNNAALPFTFPVNLALDAGNFTLEVWDEDSGAKGSDDACGTVSFNYLSNDTLVSGGFQVVLQIEKTLREVFSVDTVYVLEEPAPPAISAPNGLASCLGPAGNVTLVSSAPYNNQWLLNGEPVEGAIDTVLAPLVTGYYQVAFTTPEGCQAVSDSVFAAIFTQPPVPVFGNHINRLYLLDSLAAPDGYTFQWFAGGVPIPGETGYSICITQNDLYGLVVTDTATGCANFYSEPVVYNPAYPDCTSSAGEAPLPRLQIFPNPAYSEIWLRPESGAPEVAGVRVFDVTGRQMPEAFLPDGTGTGRLDCSAWPAGMYSLLIKFRDGYVAAKVAVIK